MKRLKILAAAAVLAIVTAIVPTSALAAHYHRTYDIQIKVECVETAVEIINGMAGHNIYSTSHFNEWGSSATFNRRVDEAALPHIQAVLRSLGEVQNESEWTNHMTAEMLDLEARLIASQAEIDRLSDIMAASANLQVLIEVESRLSAVRWQRDNLLGRLNEINGLTAMPYVNINIWDAAPQAASEEITFSQRLADAFTGSAIGMAGAFGDLVLFLAWVAIPLGLIAAIGVPTWLGVRKSLKKRRNKMLKPIVLTETDGEEEAE